MLKDKDASYVAKVHYQDPDIAQQYDAKRFENWHGRISNFVEARTLGDIVDQYFESEGTVLDIPCGTGRLLPVILSRGFCVTGGDISEEMLRVARYRLSTNPLSSFKLVDAENLPFSDNYFDYLTSFRLMCHLPSYVRKAVLSEMLRVASKIIVVNYHFDSLSPLAVFNRIFRRSCCSVYPLREQDLRRELKEMGVEVLEVRRLSFYERSSALVVIRKNI